MHVLNKQCKWEVPASDAELKEEIAFWRWALKYAKDTPDEQEYTRRFRECVWARNRLAAV